MAGDWLSWMLVRLSLYRAEIEFVEKLNCYLSSCQIKIKAEVRRWGKYHRGMWVWEVPLRYVGVGSTTEVHMFRKYVPLRWLGEVPLRYVCRWGSITWGLPIVFLVMFALHFGATPCPPPIPVM